MNSVRPRTADLYRVNKNSRGAANGHQAPERTSDLVAVAYLGSNVIPTDLYIERLYH